MKQIKYVLPSFLMMTLALTSCKNSTTATPTTTSPITASCPTNYVLIPANADMGTAAFCVSKYEMKAKNDSSSTILFDTATPSALDITLYSPAASPSGLPWVKIKHGDAITECASLGTGYHLITLAEWGAVARNIEGVAGNWSGNSVGSGNLNRGHSDGTIDASAVANGYATSGALILSAGSATDPYGGTGQTSGEQKRTSTLNTTEVIWDLGGNVREHIDTDGAGGTVSYTGAGSSAFYDLSGASFASILSTMTLSGSVVFNSAWLLPSNAAWTDASQFLGQIYAQSGARTGRIFTRGANYSAGNSPGIWAADLDTDPVGQSASVGFRCTKTP